ncbi:hypothetical protein RvY_00199 [Ramazzottius varieornatus]|uniref:Uncharacterized protein n=1 Tax=Ramazzottius varieornatus TaxID=947166 RepID=A0A1D1UJB6_RAMVA|nr:hypothetical protein RvY_00199 [Ramazzottius varieornatus]
MSDAMATNLRQFGPFIDALADVARMTVCFYPEDASLSDAPVNVPIAHANFLNKTTQPMCDRNAVFVPVTDPVNGLSLRIKTVKDIGAGEMVSRVTEGLEKKTYKIVTVSGALFRSTTTKKCAT